MQENIKTTMTPGEVTKALIAVFAARQPLIVWGAPGIGKSQVIAQTAAAAARMSGSMKGNDESTMDR